MALWGFSRERAVPAAETPAQERVELLSVGAQRRTSYRASIGPSDVPVSRFWIHEPGARFRVDPKGGPVAPIIDMEKGIAPVNMSSTGALLQLAVQPEVKITRLARQEVSEGSDKRFAPFRDASIIIHLMQKGEMLDFLITGRIIRTILVRTTQRFTVYEMALKYTRWGSITDTNIVWYKLGDDGVPPVAAWITQFQLRRAEADRRL